MGERVRFALRLPAGWIAVPHHHRAQARYAHVGSTGTPRLGAWLEVRLAKRGEVTPSMLLERAVALSEDGPRPFAREVAETVIAGRPAVVLDELARVQVRVPDPSAPEERLHRRILVALFLGEPVVQLQLSTPDLLLFDDPLALALRLAGSLEIQADEEPAA